MKNLPFVFDASQRSGLSKQLADGLRSAIVTGKYRPGETLPTILEWSKMLGVSIRVPEAAIGKLVSEGLIVARRRYGCVVAEPNRKIWRGHVLTVVPDCDACYYSNVFSGRVRSRLSDAGYLVSPITVHGTGRGRFDYDLAPLEFAIRQSVDLVVLVFNYRRSSIARMISAAGVPFVEFADSCPSSSKNCMGSLFLDKLSGMERMLSQCGRAGVKRILQVGAYRSAYDLNGIVRDREFDFSEWIVKRDSGTYGPNEGMVRDGMEAFAGRFRAEGRRWLPDLLYFTEDHVASGAFTAMLAEGVRIPDDVRVVTMSNWGLGPVYPCSLSRFEMNPYEHGEALADMALDYLRYRVPQGIRSVPLRYIEGDSFIPCEKPVRGSGRRNGTDVAVRSRVLV